MVATACQRIEEAGPDASVRVVPGEAGRMRLSVQRLEKLGDPPSLVDLRERVDGDAADRAPTHQLRGEPEGPGQLT
jgi:hypothetical protein